MSPSPEKLLLWALFFAAYFIGVIIRKVALPSQGSPSLPKQFLLGIPVSLIVVSALSGLIESVASQATTSLAAMFTTLGLVMEHGMVLNETIAKHLKQRLEGSTGS
jgi:hypothetical protein